ncbi:phage/plasmid primase, P4 family [Gordonia malaquae]|uniref:DNA primase family protein n=1 Tax=Gordonia malaquae TaxID=410332 RepID=UPI0030FE8DB6
MSGETVSETKPKSKARARKKSKPAPQSLPENRPPFIPVDAICKRAAAAYLTAERIAELRQGIMDGTVVPHDVHDDLLRIINAQILDQNRRVKPRKASPEDVEQAKQLDPTTSLEEGDFINVEIVGPTIVPLQRLAHEEMATLIAAVYSVVKIAPSNKNSDPDLNVLAAYDDDPSSEHWGTYRSSDGHMRSVARRFCKGMTVKSYADIVAALEDKVPTVTRGENPDLVAVANGIVDLSRRDADGVPAFMPFTPEHIFLAKLAVKWNPEADNPIIHNDDDGTDWDIESWMSDFFPESDPDNEGMTELLWQIIGASVRPYVSWNKAAFFFSPVGNNGKGTLVSLMRNIVGVANYASIPIADFAKDFLLEPLTRASAILVDENDVGSFVDKGANFKAVITNDVITINRKYKSPIAHQHWGFMVQCLNDEPSTKDKSESFYRRQLFVKFTKSFTGVERRYIKDDYLTRPEVLEYALKRVLCMDYDELSEPEAVKKALDEFKVANDPVRAFWEEFAARFAWDLLPFPYLYDLFKAWFSANYPTGKVLGFYKFTVALVEIVQADTDGDWECPDKDQRHRPGMMMDVAEPLTVEYNLEGWINHEAKKSDREARATMTPEMLKQNYRGLRRKNIVEVSIGETFEDAIGVEGGTPPKPGQTGQKGGDRDE